MNTRQKVLEEALKCVNGEREKQYGNPEDNFSRIADFWGLYLTTLFEDTGVVVELDPKDVAIMMILFKIARSLGDQDKLDNYVDILGYGACAAEIFENGSKKASETVNESENVYPNCEKLTSNSLDCEHCKYEPMDSREYPCSECDPDENGGTLFESDERKKVEKIELADECKGCDYAEKCIGTGVCLKDTEKKCVENGESILDNFADHVNARVRKKTKEKHLHKLDNKYDSWKAYHDISTHIAIESYRADVHPFDVVDRLVKNGNSPTEMADLLLAGKLNFDDVTSYIEDTINKMKAESEGKK